MSDDWRLALGEHGPGIYEEAYQRKELLLKAGKLVAAGAVASPLLANVERAWAAAEAASAGGDAVATTAVAAAKQFSGPRSRRSGRQARRPPTTSSSAGHCGRS